MQYVYAYKRSCASVYMKFGSAILVQVPLIGFLSTMTDKTPATALAGAWESCNEIRLQARNQQTAT